MHSQCRFLVGVLGVFFSGMSAWGVALTTHLLLAPRLHIGTDIPVPLPPLGACLAFNRTAFTFWVDLSVITEMVPCELSFYDRVISHSSRFITLYEIWKTFSYFFPTDGEFIHAFFHETLTIAFTICHMQRFYNLPTF
jgi:hypothetical protein